VTGNTWAYAFSVTGLPQGLTYTVNSRAIDAAGNTEAPGPDASFALQDITAPSSTITFPSASAYSTASWVGAITGTARDNSNGVGVAFVKVSIFDGSNYWDGNGFNSPTPVCNATTLTGTGDWSYGFSVEGLPQGRTYTVNSQATDNAGNT